MSTQIIKSSTTRAINLVGDYWSLLLIREALLGVNRYSEFYKKIAITHSTLSARLKRLVKSGLLVKVHDHGASKGAALYKLTSMGRDLHIILILIRQWQLAHPDEPGIDGLLGQFIHTDCGQPCEPVLSCVACNLAVATDDITSIQGPGAGLESAGKTAVQRNVKTRPSGAERSVTGRVGIENDRWAIMIMAATFSGVERFNEYRERLLISPDTLSNRLTLLQERNMLQKVLVSDFPARYEYRLTDKGKGLYPLIVSLMQFGDKWISTDGAPILLHHDPCCNALKANLVCDHCGKTVDLSNLRFQE